MRKRENLSITKIQLNIDIRYKMLEEVGNR